MRLVTLIPLILSLVLTGCVSAPRVKTAAERRAERAAKEAASAAAQQAPATLARPRATGTPEDARKHLLRGMAAVEMAKSSDDLAIAEDEFRMATEISPGSGSAWFNLGKVQTQLARYGEAIASYRQYLAVAPAAEDARKVQDEIVKLEFRQEQSSREKGRAGSWVGADGTWYELAIDGNRMTLKTGNRRIPEEEVRSTYTLVGSVPISQNVPAEFQLTARGNRLAGTWSRGPVKADRCTVPPDTAEAVGEISDREGKMVLRYQPTSFLASTQMALLGDDSCSGVTPTGKRVVEEVLYGPLGPAGLGPDVAYTGLTQWWAGGFSTVKFGWSGHLGVVLAEGTEPYEAGLRNADEIVAIDGVPVATLKAGEAMVRLYGQAWTPVRLDLLRGGVPVTLTIQRIPIQ